MKPVKTKRDFVKRYKAGEFGNASLTWNSLEDWITQAKADRLYHIRSKVGGGVRARAIGSDFYNLTKERLMEKWRQLLMEDGISANDLYISEMAPHHFNILQGELEVTERGWELTYSDEPNLAMRDALAKRTKHLQGLRVSQLLRQNFNDKSWDWLKYLLEEYPDHVIEFSCFSRCWGTLPGYNVVFWEVRYSRPYCSNLSQFTEHY